MTGHRLAGLIILCLSLASGSAHCSTEADSREIRMEEAGLSSPGLTTCTLTVAPGAGDWEISLHWLGPPAAADGFLSVHTVSARPLGMATN